MSLNTKKYYDRDLSWLRFNHRVLQEAADSRNPLYERLKFLAIFSSNLDEFFKVRISNIRQIKSMKKSLRKKLITKPNKLLSEIKKQVDLQQDEFGRIFQDELIPELVKENIHLIQKEEFTPSQKEIANAFFQENQTHYSPIQFQENNTFLENEELYLVGMSQEKQLIWIEITDKISRFFTFPEVDRQFYITFVDDVLKVGLKEKYQADFYSIKISRDAELYIENEFSGDLLTKIEAALPNRETGQVTRFLVEGTIPKDLKEKLMQEIGVNDIDLMMGGTHHNFSDFFGFPNPTKKDFEFPELPPLPNNTLNSNENIFESIEKQDHLLCFPYESFEDVVRFIETAATDHSVTKIQITLYRISKNSAIAHALLKALELGKEVFAFIETKARFDEANNILWGKRLQEGGAQVIYSYPGIKVHSKILHVTREVNGKSTEYAYIGTGNFNEKTAKIYTDYALLTAHPKLTFELSQVFQVLQRKIIIPKTKYLLISPFSTRNIFEELIETEIENALNGMEAYIIIKMNSLQDKGMIKLLYKASNAGVKIRLLIRGICCLVPGVKGQSENITITSIVDRFLEHSRVFLFANGGKEKLYMGSADWMTRNLDHRIEVVTPILDVKVFQKLKMTLQIQLEDQVKARKIGRSQKNSYINIEKAANQSSQHEIYRTLAQQNVAE
jgi:polyphosphate kinase